MTPATTSHHPLLASDMIAVSGKSDVKALGYVVWFSVPDRPVSWKHLRRTWASKGIDLSMLPDEPRPLFLFKRAMRAQEGKVRNNGTITETDVKQVTEDANYCIYQISRVVRDVKKRVVDYPKSLRVVFHKKRLSDPFDFQPLSGSTAHEVLPMQEAIEAFYDEHSKLIDGRKVRTVVREYVSEHGDDDKPGLSGENLRGKAGGVYFVPAKFKHELDALAEALAELHKDGSAYLYTIPLADGASERELVRRHHIANAKRDLEEAMSEATALLRDDRKQQIRADHAAFHHKRLLKFGERAKEYAALLGDEQDDISIQIELLEKVVRRLPEAVAA